MRTAICGRKRPDAGKRGRGRWIRSDGASVGAGVKHGGHGYIPPASGGFRAIAEEESLAERSSPLAGPYAGCGLWQVRGRGAVTTGRRLRQGCRGIGGRTFGRVGSGGGQGTTISHLCSAIPAWGRESAEEFLFAGMQPFRVRRSGFRDGVVGQDGAGWCKVREVEFVEAGPTGYSS